jgi:hypothetical protein
LNNAPVAAGKTVADYFSSTESPVPFYLLSRLKLESTPNLDTVQQFEELQPGHTIEVNAFVYAQEGSWVVIPGGYYDEDALNGQAGKLRTYRHPMTGATGTILDYDGDRQADAGEYLDVDGNGSFSQGDGADLNRDGVLTREEGTVKGAVQEWMNKWGTVTLKSNNYPSGNFNPATVTSGNGNFDNISYNFDPAAVDPNDPTFIGDSPGFALPVTPDLIYQE